MSNHIAKTQITIQASIDKVWDALVKPEIIKKYMFGTNVISDWQEGSKIVWQGEWKGKTYEDKGVILTIQPKTKLQYSHYSPLSELPDSLENYHKVTIDLSESGKQTTVSLSQDNNPNEEARQHSESNWKIMLSAMKKLLEETN